MERVNNDTKKGSFGIPPEMKQEMNEQQEKRRKKEIDELQDEKIYTESDGHITDDDVEESKNLNVLKELGIELTRDDYQHLIFKGYIEKNISIIKYDNFELSATMRSLTASSYDEVEEILMDEVKKVTTTEQGALNKKAMLHLCYATTKLNGKPVNKTIFEDEKQSVVNTKATIINRRKVLNQMSGNIIDLMVRKQAAFSLCIKDMIDNPEQNLKNS